MVKHCISEYFYRARDIVAKFNPENVVVLQFFQRRDFAVLAGMDEVLELLRGRCKPGAPIIRYLPNGTHISALEVVLELEGRYQDFGEYEGIIDGILARATSIATNAFLCVQAARGKSVICMADRSDHYSNQARDGRAMIVGGITEFSSLAQSNGGPVYGSVPHALIQNFRGDVVRSMELYSELFPHEDLIFLADFNNDVVSDSLKVLSRFGKGLKGVRVDTSDAVSDRMFSGSRPEFGVTPNLIKGLRAALDGSGGGHVRITVSSGFTPEKIALFEGENAPVDSYGVGEYLLGLRHSFCADAVKINGVDLAKYGRCYRPNPRLVELAWG